MPSSIDEAEVLAAYAELQNGRAVSRRTGVHENTVYQILRRHRGECVRCKAPVAPGKKQCKKCLAFDRERIETETQGTQERRVMRPMRCTTESALKGVLR